MNSPLRAVPRRLKSGTAKTVPAVPAAPALYWENAGHFGVSVSKRTKRMKLLSVSKVAN